MGWKHYDFSDAGAPNALTAPCGYVFDADGTQHVDYVDETDGHIYELLWDNGLWQPNDLTVLSGGPPQPLTSKENKPTGYVFPAQGTQHVVYVGNDDGRVYELWWDDSGWHSNDLTNAVGAPLAVPLPPCAYVFDDDTTQHVDYVDVNNHIQELWWNQDGWHRNDLTNAARAPLADPRTSPTGYAFGNTQHVYYVGEDANIHELIWDNFAWRHNNMTSLAGAPAASGSLSAYVFAAQGTQHLDYAAADDHVHELSFVDGHWCDDDLSDWAGAPLPSGPPVLCAYAFDAQGTRHVDYTDGKGHINELWRDVNGWHYNDLTHAARAPLADQGTPAGYAFAPDGTQHVFYIAIAGGHIHELRWEPGLRSGLMRP